MTYQKVILELKCNQNGVGFFQNTSTGSCGVKLTVTVLITHFLKNAGLHSKMLPSVNVS